VGALVVEVRRRVEGAQLALIDGAGGLLVPVDAATDVADLAVALDAPILLVAANALGVLSHTLTAAESARSRGLSIAAVVLTEPTGVANPSKVHNRLILETRLGVPIVVWPHVADDDDALADAADASGLAALLLDEGR
jgi:dethiobiotin synthetase